MSRLGDYGSEMFRRNHLSDDTVEQLLSRRPVAGEELLVSFVEDATVVADVSPAPSPALAALFAEEVSIEKGDLPAMAGSNVTGPAPQAAGLPKWRKKRMLEVAIAKLAALGVAAKVSVAGAAVVATTSAAAFTGTLPEPAQDRVADAVSSVVDIPGGNSADHRQDGDHRQDADRRQDADAGSSDAEPTTDFGEGVSSEVKDGGPEDGQQFGEDVSTDAQDTYKPSTVEGGADAGQQPAEAPTEGEAPASGEQPDGTPSAGDNPSGR